LAPATAAMLALAAGLAAACFVKAFGITFLGRSRTDSAKQATEVDAFSLTAMFALALACVVAGALPGYFTNVIGRVTEGLALASMPVQPLAKPWTPLVPVMGSTNAYSGLIVLACVVIAAGFTARFVRVFANRGTRRGPAWDCGFPDPSPATQYTAGSFAQPIRRVFATAIFAAQERVEMAAPGDIGPSRFSVTLRDRIWDTLYMPVASAIGEVSGRFNRFQSLTIRRYLSLVFATLVLLLLVLALWP